MSQLSTSQYVQIRNSGYYVSGTRIGLDVIVHEFQAGKSPEAILQTYPAIGSLAKIYGVITFILEHPDIVEAYVADQAQLWEKLMQEHPLSPDMLRRFYRARELSRKSS